MARRDLEQLCGEGELACADVGLRSSRETGARIDLGVGAPIAQVVPDQVVPIRLSFVLFNRSNPGVWIDEIMNVAPEARTCRRESSCQHLCSQAE